MLPLALSRLSGRTSCDGRNETSLLPYRCGVRTECSKPKRSLIRSVLFSRWQARKGSAPVLLRCILTSTQAVLDLFAMSNVGFPMASQWAHNVLIATVAVEGPLQKQPLLSNTTRDEQLDWRLGWVRLALDRTRMFSASVTVRSASSKT